MVSTPLAKPVVSSVPRSTVVRPLVTVSATGTAADVKRTLPVGVGHGVRGRDLRRPVDGGLDLGGDVDLAARVGEGRVGDDARRPGSTWSRSVSRPGVLWLISDRPLGGRRDREIGGDERGARLGERQGHGVVAGDRSTGPAGASPSAG